MGCLWQPTVRFRLDFVAAKRQIRLTAEDIFIFQTFCDRQGQGLLFLSIIPVILVRNIPPFCDSGKENKQKVRHFRRRFDIVYWIEHHPFRVTHRTNEFTVHSASQTNQRVQQPNLRVRPAYVPSMSRQSCYEYVQSSVFHLADTELTCLPERTCK